MLPCTSRNNIQALVLAGAARGALQSRVPARVSSPRPPYGFAAATARVEAAKGAGGGGNVGGGVGGGPGGCGGGGGLGGGELGGGGGGEGGCGEGSGGREGGNCRRPGLAWKGALSRTSGRSWWYCAWRGDPRPLLPRATPSAGSAASQQHSSSDERLTVTGSWRPCSPGPCLWRVRYRQCDACGSPASLLVAGSRRSCEPHGRQRLRSDQREVLPNEGGRGEIMRGSCRSREGMRETPSRCLKSCPGPRLAVAGNSPTAPCSSGPASEAREQPAGGAGRLERPCRR